MKIMKIPLLLFSVVSLAATSCAGPRLRPMDISTVPEPQDLQPSLADSRYQLQLGDEVEVKFYYQSDLNEYQAIRPDGRISLQLIDDVLAVGKTAEELAHIISGRYRPILRRAEATVVVKKIIKAKVFIGGKVGRPGLLEVDSTLTLMQAIFEAGGFLDSAEMREVLLIRRKNNYKKPEVLRLNMEEPSNDLLLHPYDIVYIPPSPISQVDAFVEDYITKIIPVTFGITYYVHPF
jgi:protein involved in polysaccharide export with SLBB domain